MQPLAIIAAVLLVPAAVMAGTRNALAGEEARALALWTKHCANGRDGGTENGIFIHCKHPLQPLTYQLSGEAQGDVNIPQQREQYIFVQPPSLHFDHSLRVNGGSALEPKTIVYVKPAKTSHTYSANINVADTPHQKPELVFLTGSPGSAPLDPSPFTPRAHQAPNPPRQSPSWGAEPQGNPSSNSGNHIVVPRG